MKKQRDEIKRSRRGIGNIHAADLPAAPIKMASTVLNDQEFNFQMSIVLQQQKLLSNFDHCSYTLGPHFIILNKTLDES